MRDLKETGRFRVDERTFARMRQLFAGDSVDNAECLTAIREVFERHSYLMDPHTAVAYRVAERLRGENPVLIASTAHWAKFGDNVYRALHGIEPGQALPESVAALSGCQLNQLIAQETGCFDIPTGLAELDALPIRFTKVIDAGARRHRGARRRNVSEGRSQRMKPPTENANAAQNGPGGPAEDRALPPFAWLWPAPRAPTGPSSGAAWRSCAAACRRRAP